MYFLTEKNKIPLPTIPEIRNHGNYIISLGNLCEWMGEQAEELGVDIFPGYAASEVLYDDGVVTGIATGDAGIGKDGNPTDNFMRGMELKAPITLFAEGCRGSCSKDVMSKYKLDANSQPQAYGIGIKEVWEVQPEKFQKGLVNHTIGWPVNDGKTWAGSFAYHWDDNKVNFGYVVGLDYQNPYLNPYMEMQRLKTHPHFAELFEGGKPIGYGARALNEGGYQSIPKLVFPGGALLGCSAGLLNVPKIKGSHTAMKSGIVSGEAAYAAIHGTKEDQRKGMVLDAYEKNLKESWVFEELKKVRNIHPAWSKFGTYGGMLYTGAHWFFTGGKEPWTLDHHKGGDHAQLKPAKDCKPIDYPKPDGKLTFDILTNLQRSGTNHAENQPAHLKLVDDAKALDVTYKKFGGPEARYCPAKVYEWVEDEQGKPKFVINAQNCLHCKTCDIKDPTQNIKWTTPEGSGGPQYSGM